MARLVFGMNQSLDGYVDHTGFAPDQVLFRHFIAEARAQTGSLYGRRMYEIMRYWDEDQEGWGEDERAFAAAWRVQPKWVASTGRVDLGPNATRLGGDLLAAAGALKAEHEGEIEVAGPVLAGRLLAAGLIDECRIYLHPLALGSGQPYLTGPRPPMRLISHDRIGENVLRLCYAVASVASA